MSISRNYSLTSSVSSVSVDTSETTWSTTADNTSTTYSGSISYTVSPSPSQRQQSQGQQCNESKIHSHEEKAVFHGMKSAFRFVSTGMKGVDDPQVNEAMVIAAEVGKTFLQTEGIEYDPEHSRQYFEDHFGQYDTFEKRVEKAIERAWRKIDKGKHEGGARIAVSLGDKFLNGFTLPE